jgi:hypothetical protein
MPKIRTRNDTDRMTAVRLLRAGYATVTETAALLGHSQQRIDYWARADRIDTRAARARFLQKVLSGLSRSVARQRPATRAGTTKNGRVVTEA